MKRKIISLFLAGILMLPCQNFVFVEELSSGEVQQKEINEETQSDILSAGEIGISEEEIPQGEDALSHEEMIPGEGEDVLSQEDTLPGEEELFVENEKEEETELLAEEAQTRASSVKIDSAHFPDKVFREYVKNHFDTNKNGILSAEEIKAATNIEIRESALTSVKGIEYFSELQQFTGHADNLKTVDLRKNKKLRVVSFTSSGIEEIKVEGLTALDQLTLDGNPITELNLKGLTALRRLDIIFCKITELDLTGLKNLKMVEASHGQLTSLKVRGLKKLETLYCHDNYLRELDVTGTDNLSTLMCNGNYMDGIEKVKGVNRELLDSLGDSFCFAPQKVIKKPVLSGIYNSASGVLLKWKEVEGAKEYGIFRRDANWKWERIGTVKYERPAIAPNYQEKTLSFTDTSVKGKNGNSYTYTVRAFGYGMQSSYDTKGKTIIRLMTPSLSNVYNSRNGALVKWKKVDNAEGYQIFRKSGNGVWKKIASVKGANTLSYTDGSVKNNYGNTYMYTVKAFKGKDSSAYNGVGKMLFRLEAPEFTVCKNMSGRKIEVKWENVPQADGYEVQYSTSGKFTWNRSVMIDNNLVQKQRLYNLTKGKQYYVRIRSYKKTNKGTSYSTWNTVKQTISK